MPRIFRLFAVGLLLTSFADRTCGQVQRDKAGDRGRSAASPALNPEPHGKSPGPYTDVTQFGVRAVGTLPATTGSIAAGSNRLTVAGGSGFVNGDGIVIRGAGANITLTTPGAPAVTPSGAAVFSGTGLTVQNTFGTSTYQYQVVARDIGGGYTAASSIATIANGPSALGSVSVDVSSWTASKTVVTVTTSSAHNLVAGQMVLIAGADGANGWWQVATVPNVTSFTFHTSSDTRLGAPTEGGASGRVTTWFCNRLTWTPVARAMAYFIYGRKAGTMALIGVSMPQSSTFGVTIANDPLQNSFDDFGSTMTANLASSNVPDWVPLLPPGSAKNDDLVTTISAGAGGKVFALAANAWNTVSGATVKFDNAPNIVAAALASTRNKTAAGTLYFPASGGSYVTSSVIELGQFPRVLSVKQAGTILLGDTLVLGGTQWTTDTQYPTHKPAFSRMALPQILSSTAYPMVYAPNQLVHFSYLNLQHNSPSGFILVLDQGGAIPASELDHVQFVTVGDDYMAQHFVVRGDSSGGAHYSFRYCTFTGGLPNVLGQTATPLFYGDGMGMPTIFNYSHFNRRGAFFRGLPQGVQLAVDFHYEQGGIMPMFSAYGAGSVVGLAATFRSVVQDTMSAPLFSYFGTMQGQITVEGANGTGGGQPLVNGPAPASFANGVLLKTENVGPSGASFSQQGLDHSPGPSLAIDGVMGNDPGSNVYQKKQQNLGLGLGNLYQMWVDAARQEAPSCSVSAGGKVPPGRHTFQVAPVFSSGGEGVTSPHSTACMATSGNQTITIKWTAVPGAVGYDLYENNKSLQCKAPLVTGGNTSQFIWKDGSPCGAGVPAFSGSGPTSVTAAAVSTPLLKLENSFTGSLSAGVLTANRVWNLPDADGQVLLAPAGQGFQPNHLLVANSTGRVVDSGVQLMPVFDDMHHQNGAIQTANPNWTGSSGTISIAGNAALGRGGEAFAVYTGLSWPSKDQTASIVLGSPGSPRNSTSVMVRGSASEQTGYLCSYSSTTTSLALSKAFGGRFTNLSAITLARVLGEGDEIAINVTGTTITCYVNGANVGTATDAAIDKGFPGISFRGQAGNSISAFAASYGAVSLGIPQTWTAEQQINTLRVGSAGTPFTNQQFLDCGTGTSCARTAQPSFITVKGGPVGLRSGAITITALPFTNSRSYVCAASDSTGANQLNVVYNGGDSVTFKGTGSDMIRYVCTGN